MGGQLGLPGQAKAGVAAGHSSSEGHGLGAGAEVHGGASRGRGGRGLQLHEGRVEGGEMQVTQRPGAPIAWWCQVSCPTTCFCQAGPRRKAVGWGWGGVALKRMSGMRSPVSRGQGPGCHPSAVPTGFLVGGENRFHWRHQGALCVPYSTVLMCEREQD